MTGTQLVCSLVPARVFCTLGTSTQIVYSLLPVRVFCTLGTSAETASAWYQDIETNLEVSVRSLQLVKFALIIFLSGTLNHTRTRNQMQETAFLARFVRRLWFLVLDFAVELEPQTRKQMQETAFSAHDFKLVSCRWLCGPVAS